MSPSTQTPVSRSNLYKASAVSFGLAFISWLSTLFIVMFFGCPEDTSKTCEADGVIVLLIVAIACLAHATLVALFAWSPLSLNLRKTAIDNSPSAFNMVLHSSIVNDLLLYLIVVAFGVNMKDLVTMLQVVTISFNFPFLLAIPYLLAAYRDPSTDIGAFLHRVKARIEASTGSEFDTRPSVDQYEYSSLTEQPVSEEMDSIYERLEAALMIIPRVRVSPQNQHQHTRSQSRSQTQVGRDEEEAKFEEETEKMRPFPRFALFVTAPNDNSNRSQPEP